MGLVDLKMCYPRKISNHPPAETAIYKTYPGWDLSSNSSSLSSRPAAFHNFS